MEKKKIAQKISEKLEYICLDLEQIPETLKYVENINFKPNTGIEENKYRQYRFVSPKELDILLSPCNRLEDTKTKYSKAKPLVSYLDPKTDEEKKFHEKFLKMLEEVDIDEIKKIEEQQQIINKKIPFKVRYPKNYLWQIYYSENDDKYFMIVTTEDQDYSTFFYVLKKQLEKKKAGKIFVPISNIDYSKEILNKTEIESLENYLWTFTNDWPSIYEVYDKTGKISLQIVGQTQVLGNIKSEYKVKLTSKIDASKFFKLVKALYIVQTEVPEYYKFEVQIDKQGEIEFQYQNQILKYDELTEFVNEQYKKLIDIEDENIKNNIEYLKKLNILKEETEIDPDETTGALWDRLARIGAELLVKTLVQIENKTAPRIPQGEEFSMAPMLKKEMSKIDWENKTAQEIKNLVRGLNPIMGTYSYLNGKKIKIWKVDIIDSDNENAPNGTVLKSDCKDGLYIKANNGTIKIIEIQGENAKRMNIQDFLRGNPIKVGSKFE